MGKLEEFTETSPEFAKARKGIEALASAARRDWRRNGKFGCYRVVSDAERELELWEKKGGYEVKDSPWGRFVCTGNRYLPWMLKQKIVPPWLKEAEVMLEVEKGWKIDCVKYARAAVGGYPIKRRDECVPAEDVYVSSEDLVLSECYSYSDITIEDIKRVFINPEAHPEAKGKAETFAKRHNIPVVHGFPEPSIDREQEDWYKKNYPPEEAEKKIEEWRAILKRERERPLINLINYLKKRHRECWDILHPPRDVVAAALAEAYDKEMHRETPVGASDALVTMIELGRKEPTLSPVFGIGQPKEVCLSPSIVKREFERKMEKLRRTK